MPVIFTHNYDISGGVVNGSDGIVGKVNYYVDEIGLRHATSCVIYVPNSTCPRLPNLNEHEVVALLETVSFTIRTKLRRLL